MGQTCSKQKPIIECDDNNIVCNSTCCVRKNHQKNNENKISTNKNKKLKPSNSI